MSPDEITKESQPATDQPSFSFIVPCYNEEQNLAGTVLEIKAAARDASINQFEIVVVDDCSIDGTRNVLSRLSAVNPCIVPVCNARNLGLGGAYKEGIKRASGTYAIMIPGDNAHPAVGITPILLKAGEADIVIPYVVNSQSRPWYRRVFSKSFTGLVNTLFALKVPYYNGLVLHRLDLLRTIEIRTNGFAYQAEAIIKLLRRGATFTSLGVELKEGNEGATRAFRPQNVYRVVKAICLLRLTIDAP